MRIFFVDQLKSRLKDLAEALLQIFEDQLR